MKSVTKLLLTLPLMVYSYAFGQIPAFPGAEGYGASTPGGRGGVIFEVTNLNDSGPGSFREACEASGPRIVIFRTGGNIVLLTKIVLDNPYITIAGQTAPGDGVVVSGDIIRIRTHDVIMRGLRLRPGDIIGSSRPLEIEALHMLGGNNGVYNVIIDHCSASWGIDKNFGIWGNINNLGVDIYDITVQWCISSEALNSPLHPKGSDHSMGLLASSVMNISIHHNLFADNNARNPKFSKGTTGESINNVIYNWGNYATVIADASVNIIGNYYKEGPNRKNARKGVDLWQGGPIYVEGNIGPGRPTDSGDEWDAVDGDIAMRSLTPVVVSAGVTTHSATEAYDLVLASAGAIVPRDVVDERVIQGVINNTGVFIASQEDVGGWPVFNAGTPPADSDNDGMPDDWELANGLNLNGASDRNGDLDADGYTNIEEYINSFFDGDPPPPPPPPPVDTLPPTITIAGPTSDPTYSTTDAILLISGTASDNEILQTIIWANAGTGSTGQIAGQQNWSINNINLIEGKNQNTVTALDAAGNSSSDIITVTLTVEDITPPTPPTNITVELIGTSF